MKLKFVAIRKNNFQQGFGLLETMAAALLSLLFVSMGANLVLTANIYKVVAKRTDAMNSLVRADVESIKYQSSQLTDNADMCKHTKLMDGYAWALKDRLGADTGSKNVKTTTLKILGSTYTMTRTIDLDDADKDESPASVGIDPNILPINYSFTLQGAPKSEYDLTVKVIPNAALNCVK
jgi:Tfp pilus assembly protein PilV